MVVYRLLSGDIPKVKKHGNAKEDVPFHPTWPSTKKKIIEECAVKKASPKGTVAVLSAKAGGIMHASAPGILPRDEKQVSNFKQANRFQHSLSLSRDAASDNLFVVMQQAYCEDPAHKYIRAVNAAPEPAIVVATDMQLQDLARFCTSAFDFSPLTVDPTFSLGAFDVTLITYRHLFLESKRYGTSPIFIGPACIHYKKNFSTYLFFASTIVGQCRALEGVRVIGTDGGQPLIDAFKHEFGFAQHLTCFIHVRRNIKEKLRECNVNAELSIEILDDILGKKAGTTYIKGLVDARDSNDFGEKLEALVQKWRSVSQSSSSDVETFVAWFKKHKAQVIIESMLSSIREECGLGLPPALSQPMPVKQLIQF